MMDIWRGAFSLPLSCSGARCSAYRLLRQGLIDDPYIGLNERKVQWVDKEDWVYETTFCADEAILADEHIDLCFDGLDTYADVFLNDSKILEADNMFRRWRINVKSLLKPGDNVLRVYFHSPVKVDLPKWAKHPYLYQAANDQSENGGLLDRKLSVFARLTRRTFLPGEVSAIYASLGEP